MRPLTLDDLIPLDEFVDRRQEFFESHARYLDRYRRVRIGPSVTLLFENRQTLWFRVQEILRVARLTDGQRVQHELSIYNRLLPGRNCLQAALILELQPQIPATEQLSAWSNLTGDQIRLHLGDQLIPAHLETCRPEDRTVGAAHWVQFELGNAERNRFADPGRHVSLEIDRPSYQHRSGPLSDEVLQSLLEDLELSDRDPVAV